MKSGEFQGLLYRWVPPDSMIFSGFLDFLKTGIAFIFHSGLGYSLKSGFGLVSVVVY